MSSTARGPQRWAVMRLIFLLLSQLAVGGSAVMLAVPQKPQLMSFFRFASGLFLFLSGLALLSAPSFYLRETWTLAGLAEWRSREVLLMLLFGIGHLGYGRRLRGRQTGSLPGLLSAVVAVGALAVISEALGSSSPEAPFFINLAILFRYLLSSATLGAVFTGMLFGHWYLNVPGLEVAPYRRIIAALLVCLALQAGLDVAAFSGWMLGGGSGPTVLSAEAFRWYLFWGRWIIGLLGGWLIAFMAWWVLRNKATQAATGLLYVAVLLVLAGELIGHFLVVVAMAR